MLIHAGELAGLNKYYTKGVGQLMPRLFGQRESIMHLCRRLTDDSLLNWQMPSSFRRKKIANCVSLSKHKSLTTKLNWQLKGAET